MLDKRDLHSDALGKNMGRFFPARGKKIDVRSQALVQWIHNRMEAGVWPYRLKVLQKDKNFYKVENDSNSVFQTLNFTSVDYLGLSENLHLKNMAHQAMEEYQNFSLTAEECV